MTAMLRVQRPRPRPLVGVLCCNEIAERPVQVVASRFITPLRQVSGATVLLVPALTDTSEADDLVERLDGLLLTGSRSNVAAHRYGGGGDAGRLDEQRDAVALALAARMIERGRPVFGICRGLQELNVLFGGSLQRAPQGHQRSEPGLPFAALFDHEHDIALAHGGLLARRLGGRRLTVNSVHEQGVDRLGHGLDVEAVAVEDGLVEAFSARPCGAPVLAVQWHPEWGYHERREGHAFFQLVGDALREHAGVEPLATDIRHQAGALRPEFGPEARRA